MIPDSFIFRTQRAFQLEKNQVVCTVLRWQRKINLGFLSPLLEQPIKFVLNAIFTFSLIAF